MNRDLLLKRDLMPVTEKKTGRKRPRPGDVDVRPPTDETEETTHSDKTEMPQTRLRRLMKCHQTR